MNNSILIVDDDKEIRKLLEISMSTEGYKIYTAEDGIQALEVMDKNDIDLLILDVMMPRLNGIEVCKRIRETKNTPILMLSAKGEDFDKIEGIITGADDYMVKPFNSLELIVRVRALLRRSYYMGAKQCENIIRVSSIIINKDTHKVGVNNKDITLTLTEFDILCLLAGNLGRVFSAEEIFERVWKEKYYNSNNTVMVHVSRIREKLESALDGEKIIQTVWGVGYKIEG
ncbi:MAG: response regulator transcription factor [Clostridium sp.]